MSFSPFQHPPTKLTAENVNENLFSAQAPAPGPKIILDLQNPKVLGSGFSIWFQQVLLYVDQTEARRFNKSHRMNWSSHNQQVLQVKTQTEARIFNIQQVVQVQLKLAYSTSPKYKNEACIFNKSNRYVKLKLAYSTSPIGQTEACTFNKSYMSN